MRNGHFLSKIYKEQLPFVGIVSDKIDHVDNVQVKNDFRKNFGLAEDSTYW